MTPITNINSKSLDPLKAVCVNCATRVQCLNGKLTVEEVNRIPANFIRRFTLKEGQYLYKSGSPLTNIYNLRFGAVKSEMSLSNGVQQITRFSLPGELLGLDAIANGKYQVNTVTIKSSEVCAISYDNFKKMSNEFPVLKNSLENPLGVLLNSTNVHLFDLINLNAKEKLADFLIDFANQMSKAGFDRDNFRLPMSRSDLANYLGIKIETLSRSITQLEKIGAIKINHRHVEFVSRKPLFEILDPTELREKHASKRGDVAEYPLKFEKRKL